MLIVGAGISGIACAHYLKQQCPTKKIRVLERRNNLGGTWDLFNYPGIRSDSDMYTFGFSFHQWTNKKAIAPKEDILSYLHNVTEEHGIKEHISYGQHVRSAAFDSESATWTVGVDVKQDGKDTNKSVIYKCRFLLMASGYYNHDAGFTPEFEGMDEFEGQIVHPQKWDPAKVEYKNKKVVVIGSGATAITIVPNIASDAEHVTMLQRSPTFIASDAGRNSSFLSLLPYTARRWYYILRNMWMYQLCKLIPARAKAGMIEKIRTEFFTSDETSTGKGGSLVYPGGREKFDADFTPEYSPWDQRVCLVPQGDFFKAIRRGDASIVTDHVDRFTANGIRLRSGEELEADLIVTATGLVLQKNFPMTDMVEVTIDGEAYHAPDHCMYKGVMVSDVPNLAFVLGYTNNSWTLKAETSARFVCRLLNRMDADGYTQVCPRSGSDSGLELESTLGGLTSGYVARGKSGLPQQAKVAPWKSNSTNYLMDRAALELAPIGGDGVLEFVSDIEGDVCLMSSGGTSRSRKVTVHASGVWKFATQMFSILKSEGAWGALVLAFAFFSTVLGFV